MDQRTQDFITAFQAFLDEVVASHRSGVQREDDRALAPVLRKHLGADPRGIAVVTEEVPTYRFVDLDVALAEIQERDQRAQLLGIGGGEQRNHHSLGELLEMAGRFQQFPVGAVDYSSVATGPQSTREAVAFGLRLFSYAGSPVAVLQRAAAPRYGTAAGRMEILSPAPGVATALITEVRDLMVRRSVLRGQVLTMGGSDFEPGVGGITFHQRPALASDDIVLPAGLLDRVHRHVAGVARHRDRLRAAGQHLKRGLLLYGPPGTGKTHTVRYLLGALPDLTVVLLSGPSIQFVSDAARMARALQPALVVLEDCDLVAENRDFGPGAQPLLFEVLEALDGLSDDADVAFLLTTNRVDVLEPALAQRPGRVDLAVEVPLPDRNARRLLATWPSRPPMTPPAMSATPRSRRITPDRAAKRPRPRQIRTAQGQSPDELAHEGRPRCSYHPPRRRPRVQDRSAMPDPAQGARNVTASVSACARSAADPSVERAISRM